MSEVLSNFTCDHIPEGDSCGLVVTLVEQNAKLRNLVQMFSKFEKNGCHECPMEEDCKVLCVYDGDCGMAVEIDEEMRELGIEVE